MLCAWTYLITLSLNFLDRKFFSFGEWFLEIFPLFSKTCDFMCVYQQNFNYSWSIMQWVQCFVHCVELRNRNWRWIESARFFFQEKLEWYQHAQKNSGSYSGWAFYLQNGWGREVGKKFKPPMMKLGTVIPYLGKIQKLHKSRDTPLEFCWHQQFLH